MTTRFPIRLGSRSRPLLRLFGVRGQDDAYAEITDTDIHARFGFGDIRTPLQNIAGARIEGPWLWITAIGIRRGVRDGVFSFAGSPRGGVRLDLRAPTRAFIFRPRSFYVGVDDLDGFAAALRDQGIEVTDARRP